MATGRERQPTRRRGGTTCRGPRTYHGIDAAPAFLEDRTPGYQKALLVGGGVRHKGPPVCRLEEFSGESLVQPGGGVPAAGWLPAIGAPPPPPSQNAPDHKDGPGPGEPGEGVQLPEGGQRRVVVRPEEEPHSGRRRPHGFGPPAISWNVVHDFWYIGVF